MPAFSANSPKLCQNWAKTHQLTLAVSKPTPSSGTEAAGAHRGQAPLRATIYELQRLRCNLCGEVYSAEEPEGVGEERYDETSASNIGIDRLRSEDEKLSSNLTQRIT